jgi:predicted RNA-binding protein
MCEANAYVLQGDQEELLLSEVTQVLPVEGGFRVIGLFGDETVVEGRFVELNLLKRRIVFAKG